MKTCKHCGRRFGRSTYRNGKMEYKGQYANRQFCSRRCKDLAQIQILPDKTCPQCGRTFNRRRNEEPHAFRIRKFCSVECAKPTQRRYLAYHFGK